MVQFWNGLNKLLSNPIHISLHCKGISSGTLVGRKWCLVMSRVKDQVQTMLKPIPYLRFLLFTALFSLLLLCWIASSGTSTNNSALAQSCPPNIIERFGVNVALEGGTLTDYPIDQLNLGWWLDYQFGNYFDDSSNHEYVHLVRYRLYPRDANGDPFTVEFSTQALATYVAPIISADPGAIWLIGNEPDNQTQDNLTAEEYAEMYHDAYTFIKAQDASAQIGFGGTSMPTRLRQKYLDNVISAYQQRYGTKPPVDIVHVHGFVMSEVVFPTGNQVAWGFGVPRGMDGNDSAVTYVEPEDHWNLDLLRSNLTSFRQWMATNGYQNKPLIVSEYGVLLPDVFDTNGVGSDNFMTASFDFFLDSTDGTIGLASDGNRLVQSFSWFSLNFPDTTDQGPLNGALFVPNSDQLTNLGETYKGYTEALLQTCGITPPPPQQLLGDVNCDNNISAVDALFVLQYSVGARNDSSVCPLTGTDTLYAAAGDVNNQSGTNAVDALFILQCVVGVNNPFCPAAATVTSAEEVTAAKAVKQIFGGRELWHEQNSDVFLPLFQLE